MVPASGAQYEITFGSYRAVIASVGASLRELQYEGRNLVVPFAADEVRPNYRGTTLAPWPNRVVAGTYIFDNVEHQLALTEPSRGHALHGLLSWADYDLVAKTESSVTLQATVAPQAGYPWRVRVQTTYALAADGLTQQVTATNESEARAPWGTGPHPYLVAGEGLVDDWTLSMLASKVLQVTEPSLAPTTLAPVSTDAERFDFRRARPIGAVEIDHAFTDLARRGGLTEVEVRAANGSGVAMVWGSELEWVQIHTADLDPQHPGHRVGLAVEPMTCAPDAFNADDYGFDTGLIVLDPAASHTAEWRIHAL